MTDETIDRRDYGRLEAQVEQLARDVHTLKETVEGMRDMMQQARGGWRAIALVSGVAATMGAAISWVASHVKIA
jgi:hypothetical protein